jgi:hypothetical protein
MIIFRLRYLIIFFFFFPHVQAQKNQTTLVFFEEEDLSRLIESIMIENKNCKAGIWYLEIKDSSNFLLSKTFLPNLIKQSTVKNNELYMTTIYNKIVFILTDSEYDFLFRKTFFRSELPEFTELDYVYFHNFSFWHLQNKDETFYVKQEKKYNCN